MFFFKGEGKILVNEVLIKGSLEPPDNHVSQLGGSNGLWHAGMVFL